MLRYGEKQERLYFFPYKPVSLLLTHQGILSLRIFVPSFIHFKICIAGVFVNFGT